MAASGDWSGLTCAVTGGCGAYGAFLVRALVKAGAQVRVLDLRRDDHLGAGGGCGWGSLVQAEGRGSLAEAEAAGKAKLTCCNLSAADQTPVKEALTGVSVVFHTVAYFGDPAFTRNEFANPGHEDKMRAINITAVEQLMGVARECGVKAFVHTSSTNTIFPGRKALVDVTEDTPYPDPAECIDLYSVTKAEAERLVISASGKGGMYTASTRPNGIYGPTERNYGIIKMLEGCSATRGLYFKFHDANGKEPIVDWCHVENLALVQMLVGKQLLAKNEKVCGSIYNASDDVVGTNTEFFGEVVRGAGWGVNPLVALPAGLFQTIAYSLEATCYGIRKVTGWRTTAPLNSVEAAKATMDNYQNVSKAKKDLAFVAIPQSELMKGMAAFSKSWVEKYATVPSVPLSLWIAISCGMSVTLFMSFADTQRFDGMPWRVFRDLAGKVVPAMASMPLDVLQRKVFRIGICLPMLGVHFADALVAAHLAKKQANQLWLTYGLRTAILGYGQLGPLLPPNSAGAYGLFVAVAFGASAIGATIF